MAISGKQLQFRYSASGVTSADSSNTGYVIFDKANNSVWVNGYEWILQDTHLTNYFKVVANTTDVSTFYQNNNVVVNVVKGSNIDISIGTNTTDIYIKHVPESSAGLRHIPTGGSTGKYLTWTDAADSSNVTWSTSTIGNSYTPIKIVNGVPTKLDYTIQTSVPSNAVFTDHTYSLICSSLGTSTKDAAATNPFIHLVGTDTSIQFNTSDGSLAIASSASREITLSVGSGHQIPASATDASYAAAFYKWYSGDSVSGAIDKDGAIENWNEIKKFLNGINDSSTLAAKLLDKSNLSHLSDHAVVSSSAAGMAPQITESSSTVTTIATQANEWVLTSTSGATPTWRKLPTTAFENSTYSSSYTVYAPTSESNATEVTVNTYTPSSSKTTNFKNGSAAATTHFVGTTGVVTFNGPQMINTVATTPTGSTGTVYDSSIEAQTYFWTEI